MNSWFTDAGQQVFVWEIPIFGSGDVLLYSVRAYRSLGCCSSGRPVRRGIIICGSRKSTCWYGVETMMKIRGCLGAGGDVDWLLGKFYKSVWSF